MDRLDAMTVLVATADEGSLSAAARRLRMPLATVSRKVAELEKHLQTQLIVRTSRRVSLTDAGRDFLAASRQILEQVEEAEAAAAGSYGKPQGQLGVTAPVMFGRRHVLPVAMDFLAAYPAIDLRLFLVDRYVNMVDEHVDVAIRIGHLEDSALIATRLGAVRRVICASPAYLERHGTPADPDDLPRHDGITYRGFSASPEWRYRRDGRALTVEPKARLAVNTTEAAVEAAVAGIGIARVLSYQVRDEIASGALVPILEEFAPEPLPVSLVYPDARRMAAKVRAFIEWAVPRLRARLA